MGASKRPEKAYSCVRCFDRKVKCTKQIPCTACTKASVECVFRQPAPPRRRKKRTQEELLLARLRRCEDILKSHGLSPDLSQGDEPDESHDPEQAEPEKSLSYDPPSLQHSTGTSVEPVDTPPADPGKLVVKQGRTKYFENMLYSALNEELPPRDDILESSSDDESEATREFANAPLTIDFLLGISPTNAPLSSLHPPPEIIYKLWHVFLENFNPLTKIIHQPTLQSAIFDASFNLDKVPKGLEALMFAIYASAAHSMTDEECIETLHEEKTSLLARYRLGLRKALVRANFLATSELQVLQAFIIYLISMRSIYDSRTMWILAGVASRLAQSLGLHKDGTSLGLPPFDTEMRRRLWWQVIFLEYRSAELSGSARTFDVGKWDIKVPANVDDSDIYPQMAQAPVSVTDRATEMISCSMRYELGNLLRRTQLKLKTGFDNDWQLSGPGVTTAEKDAAIRELETLYQEKYVRFCNPSIPIHFHTMIVAKAAICNMRMMTHHPRHRADKEREQSKEELDMVFAEALKVIELDNICHSSPVFRPFIWHTQSYFQWHALLYLVGELRIRTEGPEVDIAWQQIQQVYENRPMLLTDTKRSLHVAAGGLCLKAWQARETALASRGRASFPPNTPGFIQTLRQQRKKRSSLADQPPPPVPDPSTNIFALNDQNPGRLFPVPVGMKKDLGADVDFDTNMLADFSMQDVSPMNWDEWDALVNGYETSQFQGWTDLPGLSS